MKNKLEIYRSDHIFVEIHDSPLPWVKVFTTHPYRELSEAPPEVKTAIFQALDVIEKAMLESFQPTKINLASFGNYLPHLHFHITARFDNDTHFPEPMWGQQQREEGYAPAAEELQRFYSELGEKLKHIF